LKGGENMRKKHYHVRFTVTAEEHKRIYDLAGAKGIAVTKLAKALAFDGSELQKQIERLVD
jgi:hypothetical protein